MRGTCPISQPACAYRTARGLWHSAQRSTLAEAAAEQSDASEDAATDDVPIAQDSLLASLDKDNTSQVQTFAAGASVDFTKALKIKLSTEELLKDTGHESVGANLEDLRGPMQEKSCYSKEKQK